MRSLREYNGTLSLNEFNSAATALCERWKEINPALPCWRWITCQTVGASCNAEGYLAMENVYLHTVADDEGVKEDSNFPEEEPHDDATVLQSYDDGIHIYDYHIVYNFSYRVPVLYFRGYQCDGCPLKLDEIEKDLPPHSLKILREAKWTFMTQEDHPYLLRPWYTLHPCSTSDWTRTLLIGNLWKEKGLDNNYLSAWLSVVGQAVGLRIPLQLHTSLSYCSGFMKE